MKQNLYPNSAHLYDIGNTREVIEGDIDFYLGNIGTNQSVLEIGCGTGRVAIALARRGNRVVGLDLSPDMLQVFREKLEGEVYADKITLHEGDMENFALGECFDWVIFPFRAFQSLASDASRKACLESVKKHMKDDSRVVLTLFNPNDEILATWGKQNVLDFEGMDEKNGWQVKRYQDQLAHDKQEQTISARLRFNVYSEGKLVESCEDELTLGYLYPSQCEALFDACGFKIEHAYGAYDKSPIVNDQKKEQIYILSLSA